MSIEIDEAVLYIARKAVSPAIVDLHRKYISQGKTFKYPITEVEVRSFVIPTGITSHSTDSPLSGKV